MVELEIKKGGKSEKHKLLQRTAIGWLYSRGCSVFAEEVPTRNGIADALGIITRSNKHTVYYIEAKASRSDMLCLKQKAVYYRSTGTGGNRKCYYHLFKFQGKEVNEGCENCEQCLHIKNTYYDTGVDFYYLIVADGISVEDSIYPEWGVLNERGEVIRKAKRMKRDFDTKGLIENIAHVLVYKVFGKLYAPNL